MKIKTTELIDLALDWAVANIEDPDALRYGVEDWREQRKTCVKRGEYVFRWHQCWAQGGPIIEREKICIEHHGDSGGWKARIWSDVLDCFIEVGFRGPYCETPLIAAMRCYVASRLGDVVDVPDELVGTMA